MTTFTHKKLKKTVFLKQKNCAAAKKTQVVTLNCCCNPDTEKVSAQRESSLPLPAGQQDKRREKGGMGRGSREKERGEEQIHLQCKCMSDEGQTSGLKRSQEEELEEKDAAVLLDLDHFPGKCKFPPAAATFDTWEEADWKDHPGIRCVSWFVPFWL